MVNIHEAVSKGDIEAVKEHFERTKMSLSHHNNSLVVVAATSGHLELVEYFLESQDVLDGLPDCAGSIFSIVLSTKKLESNPNYEKIVKLIIEKCPAVLESDYVLKTLIPFLNEQNRYRIIDLLMPPVGAFAGKMR